MTKDLWLWLQIADGRIWAQLTQEPDASFFSQTCYFSEVDTSLSFSGQPAWPMRFKLTTNKQEKQLSEKVKKKVFLKKL